MTVVAWPIGDWAERRRRVVASLLALPVVVVLTTPIGFVGVENMRRHAGLFDGAQGQMGAMMQPFVLMELGGRWLLPLVAAALCIRLAMPKPQGAPASVHTQGLIAIRRKMLRYYLQLFW